MSRKADFFVIGAAKAGTTTVAKQLQNHPGVYISPIKEPNFFSTDIEVEKFCKTYRNNAFLDVDSYFSKESLEPLQLSFVRKEEHYNRLFAGANGKVAGECSTSYLFSDVAAEAIKAYNPDSKIIAVLRNPVERCFSHYLMAYKYGFTTKPFREALDEDMSKQEKGWGVSELFIELGMYARELKRYYDVFPEDQILVLLFDDLKSDPTGFYGRLFAFLGVENVDLNASEKHNVASMPKVVWLNKLIRDTGILSLSKKLMPTKLFGALKQSFYSSDNMPELSGEDAQFLSGLYAEDVCKTEGLTGLDLSVWK